MRLSNKVAIVTGSAQGLGWETAKRFLAEGAKVAIADYRTEGVQERIDEIPGANDHAIVLKVDVADQESVQNMVQAVIDRFGRIDILINNAGITKDAMLKKMEAEDFKKVIDVNLTGIFYCTQAVAAHMEKNMSGKIINTSSVSGVYGNVGQTNYAAAKAGVIGMTKTWAKELGRKGINVNAVAPGFIETPMITTVPEQVISRLKEQIPLKRLGKPADIANAYLFLASDEADYINGATIHVDGGIIM